MTDAVDLFGRVDRQLSAVRQLPLPLGWRRPTAASTLLAGKANRQVLDSLAAYHNWPEPIAVLYGPPHSGKSLVARYFQNMCTAAEIADHANAMNETDLFHACNRASASRAPLLMIITGVPGSWRPALPDLATRVAAAQQLVINDPDQDMVEALLVRRLDELGVRMTPEALAFVMARAERTYGWVHDFCTLLAKEQHEDGHAVNLFTVRRLLAAEVAGPVADIQSSTA